MYKNKNILIFGMGRSSYSVAKLLKNDNSLTVIADNNESNKNVSENFELLGANVILTDIPDDFINDGYDLVVKSPGIIPTNPLLIKAKKLNVKIENEIEIGYNFLPKDIFIVGITGSNGKTTTTTMLYEALKSAGENVVVAGNIGIPLCDVIKDIDEKTILVIEISDHQLLNVEKFKTNISVLTNIVPTHLDYHNDFESYKETKKIIFNNHTNSDLAIINSSCEHSCLITSNIESNKIFTNNDKNFVNDIGIYIDNELIIDVEDIRVKGKHNYENIMQCLVVLKKLNISDSYIKDFLKNFNGVEHRIEFVREFNNYLFYNDSKATNITSVITAIKTFKEPINLILGGKEANQDFTLLNKYLNNVKTIYAVGELTNRVAKYAKDVNIEYYECGNIKNALDKISEKNPEQLEIVLLSPGAPSFDQYSKFEDRGAEFKEIVKSL